MAHTQWGWNSTCPVNGDTIGPRKDRTFPYYGGIDRTVIRSIMLHAGFKVENWIVEPLFIRSMTPFEVAIMRKIWPSIEMGVGIKYECGESKVGTCVQHP